MQFRFYLISFCVAVFSLTALGLTALYARFSLVHLFWLVFAYVIAICSTYIFVVQPLRIGERKLEGKTIVLLMVSMIAIGGTVTHTAWTIITPKWAFALTTDKSSYALGEEVRIAASLQNLGLMTHSFKSALRDPVAVYIEWQPTEPSASNLLVWHSPYHWEPTQFSLTPGHSLERHVTWNQTNTVNPWFWADTYMPGTYQIIAFIPDAKAEYLSPFGAHTLFISSASFNVS